jgi:PhnB protein
MARVSTYLNFAGNTEEAFLFYKSVFKTEFDGPLMRFKDGPPCPGQPPLDRFPRLDGLQAHRGK